MRQNKLLPLAFALFFVLGNLRADDNYRLASTNEIQQLFTLAISRPVKCHIIGDIELISRPATSEEIHAEAVRQGEMFQDERNLTSARKQELENARSIALAPSMSGRRIQHVTEWYSGTYYRLDITDEAMESEDYVKKHHDEFKETFVNIHDTKLSPYQSFSINNQTRMVLVSKDPEQYFATPRNLWRASTLDKELINIIISDLIDYKSLDIKAVKALNIRDSDTLLLPRMKADLTKVQKLHDGSLTNFHLKVKEETLNGLPVLRYQFDGNCMVPERPLPPSLIEATYWIGNIVGRVVCVQAVITNLTLHTSFSTQRGEFDEVGLAHVWNTSTVKDGTETQCNVKLKSIELEPRFSDSEVFAPKFPNSYFICEAPSNHTGRLQNPDPRVKTPKTSAVTIQSPKAKTILCILLVTLAVITIISATQKNSK